MKPVVALVSALLAACAGLASAEAPAPDVLRELIQAAAASETPSLGFLQALGGLDQAVEFSDAAVFSALDELGASGVEVTPELTGFLDRVRSIEVGAGSPKHVAIGFHEPFGLDLGEGYAHVAETLRFQLTPGAGGARLDAFEGFKLSSSASSLFKVRLQSVEFGTDAEGAPIARIDAGPGGVHVKRLGPPPPPEVQGEDPRLTALLTRALKTEGSPILALLAGLPELGADGEVVELRREAIEASLTQALYESGVDLERRREPELRTLREFLAGLREVRVDPTGEGTRVALDLTDRATFVSLGGDERWGRFSRYPTYTATPTPEGARLAFGPGLTLAKERYALRDLHTAPILRVRRDADGVPREVLIEGGLVRGDPDLALRLDEPGPTRPREGVLKATRGLLDELEQLGPNGRSQLGALFRGLR
ncbi:MAG: hypothetical protein R3F62_16880 [Planctomycetota bacterium]